MPAALNKQQQRQALALEQARLRLLDNGVPPEYLFDYAPELIRPAPDLESAAGVNKDIAQTQNYNQQRRQAELEQPYEVAHKQFTAIDDIGKQMVDNPEVYEQNRRLYAAQQVTGASPMAASNYAALGRQYVDKNAPFLGGGKYDHSAEDTALYGKAIDESARALGVAPERILKNTNSNWFGDDAGVRQLDLMKSIGYTAAQQNGGAESIAGQPWFGSITGSYKGFLDEDVIKGYLTGQSGKVNALQSASVMRTASSPEFRSMVEQQTGMKWEDYRDAMNNAPNSKQLWTDYLMSVHNYLHPPKQK